MIDWPSLKRGRSCQRQGRSIKKSSWTPLETLQQSEYVSTWRVIMEENRLYLAHKHVVEAMEQGLPWHEATKRAEIQSSHSTAYRLRQRMRKVGEQACREGRHGHPVKLRGEVRKFLEQTCQQAPSPLSHATERSWCSSFPRRLSGSHINRFRATVEVSNPPQGAKKSNQPCRGAGVARGSRRITAVGLSVQF